MFETSLVYRENSRTAKGCYTERNSALKETKHRLGRKAFGKRIGKSFEYFHTVGLVTS